MRRKLLRATLRSLADLGYTRASTTEICRRAKVSRGAQLHHFPTKAQLVAAAVEQVFEDRLADFQRFIERLGDAGPDLGAIYDYLWEIYRSDAFYVWMELVMASRTDERLRRRVREVDTRFTARAEVFCALALAGAGRGAVADDVVGGIRIERGADITLSQWVTHRHPALWRDPDAFDPDRFARADELPRFAYFPFSGGARQCIGMSFALMEAQLILATVLQRHPLALVPGHSVVPEPLVTLRPRGGLPMVRAA